MKVYVRDPDDLELVRSTLSTALPSQVPKIYLQGDICRKNLLTEIDGIISCKA
jgi:chorismate lyase/3-hydroxybenzoate synthase